MIDISVFEKEIDDFPDICEEKGKLCGESTRNLRPLHITPSLILPMSFTSSNTKKVPHRAISANFDRQVRVVVGVAMFGFRLMTIELAAHLSGCHPRLR
jgi:hypothetical protein